jgi:hypothetical protein
MRSCAAGSERRGSFPAWPEPSKRATPGGRGRGPHAASRRNGVCRQRHPLPGRHLDRNRCQRQALHVPDSPVCERTYGCRDGTRFVGAAVYQPAWSPPNLKRRLLPQRRALAPEAGPLTKTTQNTEPTRLLHPTQLPTLPNPHGQPRNSLGELLALGATAGTWPQIAARGRAPLASWHGVPTLVMRARGGRPCRR